MMTKKNLIRTSALVSLLMIGALALNKGGARREAGDVEPASTKADALGSKTKSELLTKETSRRDPAGSTAKTDKPADAKKQAVKFLNHPHYKDLEDYAELKSKVFRKDDEKLAMEKLLRDQRLVASLGEILLTPTQDFSAEMTMQNMALDLLFEANQAGNPAASIVMQQVISDQQIEGNQVSAESRKSLAGIKAEILYEWSAREPNRIPEIRSWLPGPVSQKIWTNISQIQEQNLYQSGLEKSR